MCVCDNPSYYFLLSRTVRLYVLRFRTTGQASITEVSKNSDSFDQYAVTLSSVFFFNQTKTLHFFKQI